MDKAVKRKAKQAGVLSGLDGRPLFVRTQHAALNTLLQSAGAVFMKQALVIAAPTVYALGGEFVANVHDEIQIEVKEEHAEEVGKAAVQAIKEAGEYFGFKCPLDAQYATGHTWADTH